MALEVRFGGAVNELAPRIVAQHNHTGALDDAHALRPVEEQAPETRPFALADSALLGERREGLLELDTTRLKIVVRGVELLNGRLEFLVERLELLVCRLQL